MATCHPNALNYAFIQACKAHRARTAALLADVNVHVGQEMILVALWQEDGVAMSQLADRLEVQPPTVSRMVQRMESSGLVERRASEDDQRVSLVFVTEKGRAIRSDIERVWRTVESEMTEGWSDEETQIFHRMIDQARGRLGGGA